MERLDSDNNSNKIIFSAGPVSLVIQPESRFFAREERKKSLPIPNFGIAVPNKLYRGSWPYSVIWMREFGIKKVFSLFNEEDPDEKRNLPLLKVALTNEGIQHVTSPLSTAESYFKAAQQIADSDSVSYVHCWEGANRTGIVVILTQLFLSNDRNHVPNSDEIVNLLKESLAYGFDFDNAECIHMMENLLNASLQEGLWKIK